MGVTVEIEVGEDPGDCPDRAVSRHLACPDEPSETLGHFNVHQVGRMELVLVSEEARLDPKATRRCRRNSSRAEASTTITRTRVPLG